MTDDQRRNAAVADLETELRAAVADLEATQADLSALRAAVLTYLDCIDASDADPMHADHAATIRAEQALRALVGRAWSDEAFARALVE